MKKLEFSPTARAELQKARAWYHDQRPGLEDEFGAEMERLFDSILESPLAFPILHRRIRRALPNRFPYKVFYIERGETIVIVAIRHQHQRTLPWLEGM